MSSKGSNLAVMQKSDSKDVTPQLMYYTSMDLRRQFNSIVARQQSNSPNGRLQSNSTDVRQQSNSTDVRLQSNNTDVRLESDSSDARYQTNSTDVRQSPDSREGPQQSNSMDLRQQLAIWKRTDFILKNLTLTPELSGQLVDLDLVTSGMMIEIQAQRTNVERTLKILTLLGTHGEQVFDKFLRALKYSGFQEVYKSLKRTYKQTKLGELLPPSLTYFLNLSEFLRQNSHIAIRLGENEKHLVETFIEGKIEVNNRKSKELLELMTREKLKLEEQIEEQRCQIASEQEKVTQLQMALKADDDVIEILKSRIVELEEAYEECKEESKRCRFFRCEQDDLENFLTNESKKRGLGRCTTTSSGKRKISSRNGEVETSGRLRMMQLKLEMARLDHLVNRTFYAQSIIERLQTEEDKIREWSTMKEFDPATSQQIKSILIEHEMEREMVSEQVEAYERAMEKKEREIERIRGQVFGSEDVVDGKVRLHQGLSHKMKVLLEHLDAVHAREMMEVEEEHRTELERLAKQAEEVEEKHKEELGTMRWKLKGKMLEIHKREKTIRMLKKQMTVINRYHSKNMNAQVTVEECRKIVRSIIGEARKLMTIAEEKDDEDNEDSVREGQDTSRSRNKTKSMAPTRKKKFVALADVRLQYVATKLDSDWRVLGELLDLTSNRMDMIEMDLPPGSKTVEVAFSMLKTWRDEEHGRCEDIVDALRTMNRDDLAAVVTPESMIEIIPSDPRKNNPAVVLPSIAKEQPTRPPAPKTTKTTKLQKIAKY